MYERYALSYEQRIFEEVHRGGGIARLHICGNTTRLLPAMLRSGADIIDLDSMVDFAAVSGSLWRAGLFLRKCQPSDRPAARHTRTSF